MRISPTIPFSRPNTRALRRDRIGQYWSFMFFSASCVARIISDFNFRVFEALARKYNCDKKVCRKCYHWTLSFANTSTKHQFLYENLAKMPKYDDGYLRSPPRGS